MHPMIEQHRAEIAELCRRYAVRRLEIFGSAARGTDFDPARSDADFLVDFEPGSGLPALRRFFGWPRPWNSFLAVTSIWSNPERSGTPIFAPASIRRDRSSMDRARNGQAISSSLRCACGYRGPAGPSNASMRFN